MTRIFNIKDPLVDIIYVVPFPLSNDVLDYYMSILELVEVEHADKRINIVVPENYVKFKRHLCLTQQLLYSPKALKQIKKLTEGKSCYIVPGKVSMYDYKLSTILSVPIYSGDPHTTSILKTKSGAKQIFEEAKIPMPIGSANVNGGNFYRELTKLIASNLFINTWLFKIDTEYNGRGHASFTVDKIKTITELRKKKVEMTEAILEKLQGVIEKSVPKKVNIAMKSLFRDWNTYFTRYCEIGGVIEAVPLCAPGHIGKPSISFLIEPNGIV